MDSNGSIDIEMKDGSIYTVPKPWVRALTMKADDEKAVINSLRQSVANHYQNKTVPTKFGSDEEWGAEE